MLRVRDLVESKYLRNISCVVAGQAGLDKPVRWIHILEIKDIIKECVDGKEMVLTTGIGFTTKEDSIQFVKDLIDQGVTALCIETVLYYHQIDCELIELANTYNFPLIEITTLSRFVSISKGLNTMILNQESKLYNNTDNYDHGLSEIQSVASFEDGLKYTAEYLNVDVAYYRDRGSVFSSSLENENDPYTYLPKLKYKFHDDEIYAKGKIAAKHIEAFGQSLGYLVFSSAEDEINQFALMILGRLSNRIKYNFARDLLEKEGRLKQRTKWIREWLEGNLTEAQTASRLRDSGVSGSYKSYLVCSIEMPKKNSFSDVGIHNTATDDFRMIEDFFLYNSFLVRRAFETEGFVALGYSGKQSVSFIVLSSNDAAQSIEGVKRVVDRLKSLENPFVDYSDVAITVGKLGESYMDIKRSYRTSLELLAGHSMVGSLVFYDKLTLERILRKLNRGVTEEFVEDFLGELLDPSNSELLHTLKIYFESNCSKQNTAEKLFIARQTLYSRLEKIESILGEGYNEPDRRFALEFAINAHNYLSHTAL